VYAITSVVPTISDDDDDGGGRAGGFFKTFVVEDS